MSARKKRKKLVREGRLDPVIARQTWMRKPSTQIVPNEKAKQRKRACRTGVYDSERGSRAPVSFSSVYWP